jgi:hypothetical protein
MRYLLAAIPALIALVIVVVLTGLWLQGVPWRVGGTPPPFGPAPVQPVAFYHSIHATTLKLDCQFCHRGAATGPAATVPAVEQCMFCHSVVTGSGAQAAEIAKVRAAWDQKQPIDWVRVTQMPDHVHFVHSAHIQRGFDCTVCHGNVAQMQQVAQVRSLRMGDCVACHRANNGPTDCFKCHY